MHLTPGTTYEIQAGAKGGSMSQSATAATWSNTVPVAKTVKLTPQSGVINLNEAAGGSAGNFPNDAQLPGAPGTDGGTDNFAGRL